MKNYKPSEPCDRTALVLSTDGARDFNDRTSDERPSGEGDDP